MHKKQATLRDIARELKLSVSTVSRALNNHYSIGADTKKAVLLLSKKLDYKPNLAAISLLKKKNYTIGVVIPKITNHFYSNVISGIEEICLEERYNVIFCQSNESLDKEIKVIQTLISGRVDGMLICVSKETKTTSHLRAIVKQEIPLVFFDRVDNDIQTGKVVVDDFEGAATAVKYLLSRGCKKIAHIGGPTSLSNAKNRLEGYLHALKINNVEIDENLIFTSELNSDEVKRITNTLLRQKKPDAIFAFNDYIAYDAMEAIKEYGLNVPKDISLVGFSNEPISRYIQPSLTTISQPSLEMGKEAMKMLLEIIKKPEPFKDLVIVLKTQLIVRESTV